MTVKFNVVERGNPSKPAEPKKFYPSIQSTGRLSLRELAERIASISTVSSADTMAMLEALLTIIPNELASGKIVELGELGSFWLKAETTGCASAGEVSGKQVSNLLPYFKPGKLFKRVLDKVKFEKA
jgi:predicted histone-like DNA-binding protein